MTTIAIVFGAISVALLANGIVQIIDDIISHEDNIIQGGISFIIGAVGLFLCLTI